MKEYNFDLTLDNYDNIFISEKITGLLDTIRIISDDFIYLYCYMKDDSTDNLQGLLFLKLTQFIGDELIPLRIETFNSEHNVNNYSHDKLIVNDRIIFFIKGKPANKIKIQLRLQDG